MFRSLFPALAARTRVLISKNSFWKSKQKTIDSLTHWLRGCCVRFCRPPFIFSFLWTKILIFCLAMPYLYIIPLVVSVISECAPAVFKNLLGNVVVENLVYSWNKLWLASGFLSIRKIQLETQRQATQHDRLPRLLGGRD
jgi:hypothetical protein